jgi:ABC-type nickel/cobalt efflux system permease component RcnA
MGRRLSLVLASIAAVALLAALPAIAAAHPLGNFTINHFADLTVAPSEVRVDVVIDMAEIPTFQERQKMDTDGDGTVSDAEAAAAKGPYCASQGEQLRLTVGGTMPALHPTTAAISFPGGLGGLSTMRLECSYVAPLATRIAPTTAIAFADTSYKERIGWREIIAAGEGVTLDTGGLPTASVSKRLTSYPADLISTPLDIRSAALTAIAVVPVAASPPPAAATSQLPAAPVSAVGPGAVPGGIGGDLPSIFRAGDLTPFVLLLSIVTAFALGAGHALTPGHGKTLMAAYLVGARGTPIHAVGLGLSVTVSHTLGILVIAALVVGAQGLLAPDVVVRAAPAIAAVTIAGLGGWMLLSEVRKRVGARRRAAAEERAHEHAHAHGLDHAHPIEREHEPAHEAASGAAHSHGGVTHSHVPPAGATLTWRGLFALGLAGGLIPSTSALFILLGSIVAGRPAFGFVLVVVFGLGMAVVMTAIGLATVVARGRLDRMPATSGVGRLTRQLPLVAAVVVLAFGVYLSIQAIGGPPVL